MSRTTLWRNVEKGLVPAPIKIGGTNRWQKLAIENWLVSKGIDINLKPVVKHRDVDEFC